MAEVSSSADFDDEVFTLNAENELRFIVDGSSSVCLELNTGLAEVYGSELEYRKKYTYPGNTRVAVFTWQGCTLTLSGKVDTLYVARETPLVIFVNVHAAIEQLRQLADISGKRGPCVLIAGPKDVGKSTLCRFLLNYAKRQERTPFFIDLDVGQSDISLPGTVGGLVIDVPGDPVLGFSQKMPLVYHFGHKSPGNNIVFYNTLVSRLAQVTSNESRNNASGMIINTCGWVRNDGYRAITHAALAFEVDIVLILGHERVYHELSRDLPPFVKVVYLPRFGGATERNSNNRIEARENLVRQYFYGVNTPLHPHSFTVNFSDITLYKICKREQGAKNNSGVEYKGDMCLIPVLPSFSLLNRVLSVTHCSSVKDDVLHTNIAGFICITKVDSARKELTVLSPEAPPLPKRILLFSDVLFSQEIYSGCC